MRTNHLRKTEWKFMAAINIDKNTHSHTHCTVCFLWQEFFFSLVRCCCRCTYFVVFSCDVYEYCSAFVLAEQSSRLRSSNFSCEFFSPLWVFFLQTNPLPTQRIHENAVYNVFDAAVFYRIKTHTHTSNTNSNNKCRANNTRIDEEIYRMTEWLTNSLSLSHSLHLRKMHMHCNSSASIHVCDNFVLFINEREVAIS